jgi:hypothetical protein
LSWPRNGALMAVITAMPRTAERYPAHLLCTMLINAAFMAFMALGQKIHLDYFRNTYQSYLSAR